MPKIPDCDRCTLYAYDPHLVCAVHPQGVETDKCLDFRLDPNAEKKNKVVLKVQREAQATRR